MSRRTLSLEELKKRKDIFNLRESKTLKEIGEIYKLSPERIRQISNLYRIDFDRLEVSNDILNKLLNKDIDNLARLNHFLKRGELYDLFSNEQIEHLKRQLDVLGIK